MYHVPTCNLASLGYSRAWEGLTDRQMAVRSAASSWEIKIINACVPTVLTEITILLFDIGEQDNVPGSITDRVLHALGKKASDSVYR